MADSVAPRHRRDMGRTLSQRLAEAVELNSPCNLDTRIQRVHSGSMTTPTITRVICSECGVGNFVTAGDRAGSLSDLLNCTESRCENQGLSLSHDIMPNVNTDEESLVWDGPFLAVATRY